MAIMVAIITCFAVIPLAAYAVDIGVQRVARRDIQAVADVVALDLARQLGEGKTVAVGNKLIAVFRVGEEFHAIDDACPHMGASLAGGHLENNIVTCPWHAWHFSVCDGTWCDNPRIKIDAFETRVVDDEIQVRRTPNPK